MQRMPATAIIFLPRVRPFVQLPPEITKREIYRAYMNKIGLLTLQGGRRSWLCTGIMFQESEVGLKHILDGASKTYLIGERYLDATKLYARPLFDGGDTIIHGGDNWGWYHWF